MFGWIVTLFSWIFTLFSWILSLLGTLFWVALFVAGCFVIFFTLKSTRLTESYKYGLISTIGLLAYCMVYLSLQSPAKISNTQLFRLNNYYYKKGSIHNQLQEKFEFRAAFEDHSGSEVDLSMILDKKRYFTIWETPLNFEFTDVIVDLLDKKGTKYLYADLSILASLEEKYKDKVYFWGLFAQSLISHLQEKRSQPITLIFDRVVPLSSVSHSETDVRAWEYFSETLATVYRKLDYVNILVITEHPPVMDALEGTALSRTATFKRIGGFHKEKLQGFVANYINSNLQDTISPDLAARYAVNITQASSSALEDVVQLVRNPERIKSRYVSDQQPLSQRRKDKPTCTF